MDIVDYIQRTQVGLSKRPYVANVESPTAKRLTHQDRASINAKLYFIDDSVLVIHEIVDTSHCYPQRLNYSFQYMRNGDQVFRYDNARHHRDLPNFPHHKHTGPNDEDVTPSQEPSYNQLFDEIQQNILRTLNTR
jgi:hypothetical protein